MVVIITYLRKTAMCLLFATLILIPATNFAQLKKYKFEDLEKLQRTEKRPVIIFIHTDWCTYCQTMKNITFKNKDIIESINKHFYFIDFNAEETKDITFKDSVFKFSPTGINTGTHSLANHLGTVNGKISYPTLCFLNTNNEIIYQYPEFINSLNLKKVLSRIK